ncbi:nitrilase-related carbon-nitrogen hydrolase [Thermodesulfovibrio sp.]|uniref:nitrilase-related carbon-nitrogen hydrolase n=1 Tax=Thermodesulfovibrio sp. TaxID=2067987 RepID=UPI0030994DBF
MKIAIGQIDVFWKSPQENLKKIRTLVQKAAETKADVVVFPECCNTAFCIERELIEEEGGITEKILSDMASFFKINIIAGYFLKIEGKNRNAARVFLADGKIVTNYYKMKLFSLLNEDRVFLAGESPVLFRLNEFKCSIFICFDLRFPELFRKVIPDVEVIFVIANWPSSRAEHWRCLLRARAIENQCYVIGVNRVGWDGNGIEYAGLSSVYDPFGELLIEGGNEESLLVVELQRERLIKIREKYPFLRTIER